ncbi:sulfate permease [Halomicronema hongdechloris C2206]|uniref:Sulfate permease n=1 Tax=Halomicronema hongdechloris C2206 TaxID=1641165 RepID=A0A1Z3HMQ7_9CYAN|nr:SulP family inorganic anion transporter [Halomicronema hongdechloris]ASC71589.1 sulfate permease [Halomicronema hongdechloris C2206]
MALPVTLEHSPPSHALAPVFDELQPSRLFPSLTAGLVTGVIGVFRGISYAALIFSGALSGYLSLGVGMAVFSTAIVSIVVALASSLPGMIATPLAAPTAILALLAGQIARQLQGTVSSEVILVTVLAAIAVSSLVTGAVLWLLGRFQLGRKIRFIPYPVVGGFMAGTGWLLVDGSIQVTADFALSLDTLPQLLTPAFLSHWGCALAFALGLMLLSWRYQHFLVMPAALLASIGVFYAALWVVQVSPTEARQAGWLLGPFPEGGLWHPLTLSSLSQVQWPAVLDHWGLVGSVAVVSLLSLMLSNSGIELVVGRDLDLDTELESVGMANLASGITTGMAGNQALPSTLLVYKINACNRLSGIVCAIVCFVVLQLGASFLAYFPKPVLGALLLYLGLSLLIQWIYRAWFKLSWRDYAIVIIMLVAINALGFLQGVVLGFVLAVILFMVDYSYLDVAKQVTSGATTFSNVRRSPRQRQWLQDRGEQIFILELRGYVFFGTANYVLDQVRQRLEAEDKPAPSWIVISFGQVDGLDASGVLSFMKILKIARQRQLTVVYTGLTPAVEGQLRQGEMAWWMKTAARSLPIWIGGWSGVRTNCCWRPPSMNPPAPIETQLEELFLSRDRIPQFMAYLKHDPVDAGHVLFTQENSDRLYFIESGQVSVLLELPDGHTRRLETHTQGHVLGEMRFYGKPPLSTAVVTDLPTSLYYLERSAFDAMQQEAPELAHAVQTYLARLLCDSLLRREQQLRVIAAA